MKEGKLFYNYDLDRVDILYQDGREHGGLHAGNVIDVKTRAGWQPMRIEYSADGDDWYFIGDVDICLYEAIFRGLPVRI